jgi:small subunit ribosomal protein S8
MLSDVFSMIKNAEGIGKGECTVKASNLIKAVLKIMHKHGYIGTTTLIEDGKSGMLKVKLLGKINECRVIRPRFSACKTEFTKFEKRFLPSSNVGIIIISTSKGVMDHRQAKSEGIGGKLLGFVY